MLGAAALSFRTVAPTGPKRSFPQFKRSKVHVTSATSCDHLVFQLLANLNTIFQEGQRNTLYLNLTSVL
jgi:hypothetical protein